jgi:aspartate/methionine/tyrosine aminotransferase
VDTTDLDAPLPTDDLRDVQICRWLTKEIGVTAIPPSAFYSAEHSHLAANVARFCFCKTDAILEAAAARLRTNL